MNILFLGTQTPTPLTDWLSSQGHTLTLSEAKLSGTANLLNSTSTLISPDWIISYGYRHIIKPAIIHAFPRRIINLHISLLPWNRGADPNFWSFVDNTPKGVSIHFVDEGLDTGDIVAQQTVAFDDISGHTLTTTYQQLQKTIEILFKKTWSALIAGNITGISQNQSKGSGSYHRTIDKAELFSQMPLGWETSITDLQALVESRKRLLNQ